jgi:hypothetical protein
VCASSDGKFGVAAGLPLQPPTYGGPDNIAASATGDLALRLLGHRDALVLHANDEYHSGLWLAPPEASGTIMALAWDGDDLILALHSGNIWRIHPDATATAIGQVPGTPVAAATAKTRCSSSPTTRQQGCGGFRQHPQKRSPTSDRQRTAPA